jgi:lipid A 3-O-deacylase
MRFLLRVAAMAAFLLPRAALADSSPWADEVRFGVYQHDSGWIGTHKENGTDFALEVLSRPVTALWLIGTPRLVLGGALNTAGKTSQVYVAIDKQLDLFKQVFSREDAVFVEGTIGGVWHNGKLNVSNNPSLDAHWKSHGSRFLFRPGLAVGYRFNERWSLAASLNHISNANLAKPNQGMNDIGLLLGMRF